jgi:Xaa-Pro aminopeptidase
MMNFNKATLKPKFSTLAWKGGKHFMNKSVAPMEMIDFLCRNKQYQRMRQQPLPSETFVDNRKRFVQHLPKNAIAIFFSNEVVVRNGDQFYWPYRQNSEFYWLTGIQQENSFLILFPDAPLPEMREMLFVTETNEHIATWEGYKLEMEEARKLAGISTVHWSDKFEGVMRQMMGYAGTCFLNTNENDRTPSFPQSYEHRMAAKIKSEFPLHSFGRASEILRKERPIHSSHEIDALKKAISLTKEGLLLAMKSIRPGMMEYEIEGLLQGYYVSKGAKGFSFEPIVAGGANACILHYVTNDRPLLDGDLLLLDHGTEYNMYCSDLTRCFPVNGTFTPRQKEVYNAVLRVMRQARELLHTGNSLNDYNTQAALIMEAELLSLGLISSDDVKNQNPAWPAYKKYFPHGTGHFLGIDIHDIGERYSKLQPGMIITNEPGIYIKEEGIGIRIENDILITENGPVDLMADFPIEVEEIEQIMREGK